MNPIHLFTSTTIKLTAWYLGILMTISLLFSVIVFQVSVSELSSRLGSFEYHLGNQYVKDETLLNISDMRSSQIKESKVTLLAALFYLNCAIFIIGGVGSYALARQSLRPIEESHEAQARFASDASHELRTPLAVMRSELEVALRDPTLSKSEMKELLESNLDEVKRLSGLAQMLLQLSRHDYSSVSMKRVDLNHIVKSTIKVHSLDTSRIQFNSSQKKYHTIANSDSIKELLMILLDNALRYSPLDSIVNVSIDTNDNFIIIRIQNAGKGIAEDDLPHIFERFYRGDRSRTSGDRNGYGLGLSLAKKIADVHNAVIDISSVPNEYTLVSVSFVKFQKR
jgi:two-component system sensor histidine kinase CiaH